MRQKGTLVPRFGGSVSGGMKGCEKKESKRVKRENGGDVEVVKRRRISELPQLSSESKSDSTTGEEEAGEAAFVRHVEAFDKAALVALHLSKEVLGAMGKGDKIPSREVSALGKKYDKARQMLDGARKAVGEETMDVVETMRMSRHEV